MKRYTESVNINNNERAKINACQRNHTYVPERDANARATHEENENPIASRHTNLRSKCAAKRGAAQTASANGTTMEGDTTQCNATNPICSPFPMASVGSPPQYHKPKANGQGRTKPAKEDPTQLHQALWVILSSQLLSKPWGKATAGET